MAEATELPQNSVDIITNAQALRRFNLEAFKAECMRIGKPDFTVISVYIAVQLENGLCFQVEPYSNCTLSDYFMV